MTAYPKTSLYNLAIQQQVSEAVDLSLLPSAKKQEIEKAYPVNLYTPNFFVRLGLGVLTLFILLSFSGLVALVTNLQSSTGVLVFTIGCCYAGLELMVMKKHYNSGVDNVLMLSAILLVAFLAMTVFPGRLQSTEFICMAVVIAACWFSYRFTDSLAAIIAVVAFLASVCFMLSGNRFFPVNLVFVACMMVAVALYFIVGRLSNKINIILYHQVLRAVKLTLLLAIYFFGNQYVIINVLPGYQSLSANLPQVWWLTIFSWFCTIVLPVWYVWLGVKKRDVVLIRLGVILFILTVLTVRYYYHFAPVEVALLIAGVVLMAFSYACRQYLQQPKHGLWFKQLRKQRNDVPNIEGLVVGEVFGREQPATQPGTNFGGGSFGGAGAGSDY